MNALPEDPQTEPDEPHAPDEPDEGDEPDTTEEPTPEPEQDSEPAPLSEKEINKRVDALEREKERHAKRVSEILQEEALDLIECEACEAAIPGFHYPAAMYADGSPQQVLYELLAGGSDAQMVHPDRYRTCDYCNGFGQVLTGARNDIHRLLVCPECKGDGYRDRQEQAAPVITLPLPPAATEDFTPGQPTSPEKDFLGRPMGHPNYGKMTTYLSPQEQELDRRDGYGI